MTDETRDPNAPVPPAVPYESAAVDRARALIDAVPDHIGRYRILERLGHGGMGDVYVAEQTTPIKRRVALKLIKAGMDTRQVVARFEAERQALAMMDHPNIARVFDAGATDTGRPYFVMELVRGVPITEFCDANKLSTRQRVELLVPVCQAVQHAHQKGIIHRDIKPSNVLVTLHDGKPVPKVIDFGIAKATSQPLADKTVYTEFRAMIGTPAYMSPEQAEMSGLDIDTRSDIYSLGVLTYELLTGTTPFDTTRLVKAGLAEIQRIIKEEDPPRPSLRLSTMPNASRTTIATHRASEPARLGKLVAGELDWIVMKSLEKDRRRRYETANDLAADLNRHLAGEPIEAAPPSSIYRVRKFTRKHRGPITVAGTVVIALSVGMAGTIYQWRRAERSAVIATSNEAVAETQRSIAEQSKDAAETEAYIANLALGQTAMQVGRWPEARERLDACPESKRGWEWKFLRQTANTVRAAIPAKENAAFFYNNNISPDRTRLITHTRKSIQVWNTSTGEFHFPPVTIGDGPEITDAILTRDGSRIVVSTVGGTLYVLDAVSGRRIGQPLTMPRGFTSEMEVNANGTRVVLTDTEKNLVQLFDLETSATIGPALSAPDLLLRDSYSGTSRVEFSRDGDRLLQLWKPRSGQFHLKLWDTRTGQPVGGEIKYESNDVFRRVISQDGQRILFAERLWDLQTGLPVGPIIPSVGRFRPRFSDDGKWLVTAASEQTLVIRAASTGLQSAPMMECSAAIDHVRFVAGGTALLISFGWASPYSEIWDVSTGKRIGNIPRPSWPGLDEQQKYLLAEETLWDPKTGKPLCHLPHDIRAVGSVLSPDGHLLATLDVLIDMDEWSAGIVRVWKSDGQSVATWRSRNDPGLFAPLFLPSGQMIAIDRTNSFFVISDTIERMDANFTHLIKEIEMEVWAVMESANASVPVKTISSTTLPASIVSSRIAAVLPDGSRAATSADDSLVRFWETHTGRLLVAIPVQGKVTQLRFTTDGTRLLINLEDGTIEIWDTRDYAARQKDRDARFDEIPAARAYVQTLLAATLPAGMGKGGDDTYAAELKARVRNDASISTLRKLVALEQLDLELRRREADTKRSPATRPATAQPATQSALPSAAPFGQ